MGGRRVCDKARLGVVNGAQSLSLPLLLFKYLEPQMGFPGGANGKEPACHCRRYKRQGFNPWVGKIPWRRKWQPTPVFLTGKPHGQRSLADYSPLGHKRVGCDLITKQQ